MSDYGVSIELPCNVVLRSIGENRTIVEALDPAVMVSYTGNPALEPIASEARAKLTAALESLNAS